MTALLEGFKTLGVGRLAAMGGVAVAMLLMMAFLVLRSGGGDRMALLYSDIDLREASQIVELLEKAHIQHEAQGDGSRLMVPAADIPRARMLLAKEGLPTGGSIGYEIFDRGDGLTASQFQQAINQTRAMEGELARSIRMIMGVKAARVHLVLPKREPFARDRQEAQASVVLVMSGAARMDREGVQSVLNLVSAAVPGLRPQNIGIIDSRGNLLARAGEAVGAAAGAVSSEEVRHLAEQRLSRAVEDMLERTLGTGRVRAETAVDMDFGQTRETQELYDPDGKVERSTQSNTDNTRTTEQAATVSVANNLPNADAGTTPSGSQEQRTEETTNYEIGKTVRTIIGSSRRSSALASLSWWTKSPSRGRMVPSFGRIDPPTSWVASRPWPAAPSATTKSAATRWRWSACASRPRTSPTRRNPPYSAFRSTRLTCCTLVKQRCTVSSPCWRWYWCCGPW